ncbi:MAG: type IV secretory system conjugative DNA transfer family protein [Candidatus Thiodiazotropha sp. (ex Lucina aurantia)]|nr:type IV secretory system conjugative DNA transfer family protein [Candidatus Thiodiazotropha taylori]MBV2097847.1 type IV secretory system conjugative DNA transfer family protein [Candidatus Thiodiazotropha sp. (ex Codakia orbicularis)]MBV2103280.1 type IV secretory system conjugative DNA transfer family protein [Candidatus Thiodiazotropha sp. (ex Lucina aurantia)]MBV2116357.1 type IV secretory system conjugative DNA transfer family protein [Candidatus Thiodiazotropha sp. (ex Lucina aurantia)
MRSNQHVPAPRIYSHDPYVHGSARWATREHLKQRKYGENGRIFLGYGLPEHNKKHSFAISTSTARHGTVIGPTRSGKGVCFVVPHFLDHLGSIVGTDIKDGEIARITALYRRDVLGQDVFLLDPWDRVASTLGMAQSCFNPLDWLDPKSDEFVDNAFIIADALVVSENVREPFWSDEAKALLAGLCMYVKTAPKTLLPSPEKGRTLGQVRDCLNLGPKAFQGLVAGEFVEDDEGNVKLVKPGMAQSRNVHVRAAAGRIMNKSPKERSGVLSTAQANTHFLESPSIQLALSRSDFDPKDLEHGKTTINVVMSPDKHHSHNRFLRLMMAVFLATASRFKTKPNPPVSFVLEEANALGSLPQVTTAYSLLAGQGVQVISIWQDLNQMAARYENWQTMIANSGFILCLATRDHFTADYLSKMCGTTTIEHVSEDSAHLRAGLFADPNYLSRDDFLHGRALITPDEIMTMHPCAQLLLLAHAHPVTAYKTAYFLDKRYRDKRGQPIYTAHPHYADSPLSRPVNFTKAGLDIGLVLEDILDGG